MKSQVLCLAFSILSPTFLLAQGALTPETDSRNPFSLAATEQNRSSGAGQIVSLSGKVAIEGGSGDANGIPVVLECGGQERARVNSDSHGDFAMTLSLSGTAGGDSMAQQTTGVISSQTWSQCELFGDEPGYTSEHLRMFGAPSFGMVQLGTIMLHPLVRNPNAPSISVTSLQAPDKAKRAFEKGQEQARKGKWQAACDYFKRAVQAYPRFAVAWLELGRSQLRQNDFNEAQQSFHKATQQDPHFIEAYEQMANLAVEKREWNELADTTQHLVELSPESNPAFWFLNSAANFNLGNVAEAESSATHGLRLDEMHKVPQLEYLYGMILQRRGDLNGAITHVQTYLRLDPKARDAAEAQARLGELQKLAASQKVASR